MDYKEKVIELLKSNNVTDEQKEKLKEIFPELKESEDERIRKELIDFVKSRLAGFPQCEKFIAWLEKQGEQNPAWSEEDDNCLSTIIAEFSKCAGKSVSKDEWMRCNDFLNSLRERVLPQPKQKWSEEDSRILYNVKAYIGYAAGQRGVKDELFKEANEWLNSLPIGFIYNKNYNEDMVTLLVGELKQIANDNNAPEQYQAEINWLKSLRPQNTWKPSEEQFNNTSCTHLSKEEAESKVWKQ